jgi:hypothetical protein
LLIVDASLAAIRAGSTDPSMLLGWVNSGVIVYSLQNLHAKMIIGEGERAFVVAGSANGSASSADRLYEAAMISDGEETVEEARQAWMSWQARAGERLTKAWLQSVLDQYAPANPPKPEAAAADQPEPEAAAEEVIQPSWPRPEEIRLAKLMEADDISAEAEAKLEELREHYGVEGSRQRVDLFYRDDPDPEDMDYHVGQHVIPVSATRSNQVRSTSKVNEPGQVVYSYEDSWHRPPRNYYYLRVRESEFQPRYADMKDALAAVGAELDFDTKYMIDWKVDAILGLWPDLTYTTTRQA